MTDYEIIEKMEEEFDNADLTEEEIEKCVFCNRCPLKDKCGAEELFYGCGVWEASMGEDL